MEKSGIFGGSKLLGVKMQQSYGLPKEPIMEMDIVAQLKEGHGFGEQLNRDYFPCM